MANSTLVAILAKGVDTWNRWREENAKYDGDTRTMGYRNDHPAAKPDLTNWDGDSFRKFDINRFVATDIPHPGEIREILLDFYAGQLSREQVRSGWSTLNNANLSMANVSSANLSELSLRGSNLNGANLSRANLDSADLAGASLDHANLTGANLELANLKGANLTRANLNNANLKHANLEGAILMETDLSNANFTGCRIYGISAWNVKLSEGTKQQDLIITDEAEPEVTVDNIEAAQFVYLLLHNEKIRDVIDTVGRKGVLLLGRFTEGRIAVLDRLRNELRKRGYLPIVFNFDKPETKDFTETVRLLAGLSRFVIADITNPKSAPLELQATVPEIMVPFRPIIEEGEKPFAMLQDLWIKHRDWVFEPLYYSSHDALVGALDEKIIRPAELRFAELLARKAEKMKGEHV